MATGPAPAGSRPPPPSRQREAAKARFEGRELQRQFQEVESLSDDDKLVAKKLLDAFPTKKQI